MGENIKTNENKQHRKRNEKEISTRALQIISKNG